MNITVTSVATNGKDSAAIAQVCTPHAFVIIF